jgi:MoxR-like ATPase
MIGGYRKRKLQEWKGSDLASLRRSVVQRSRQAESPTEVREVYGRLRGSIRRVIVGKDRVVDLCLISLLAGGHVLLTDIPGVGKTTLAKAISSSIAADFSRIQFTPDLLPSDITGTSIYDPREARFRWMPGPVFASVLLADEINRATPRTQSALLEAMAEDQVTVDGETRALPEPFFVVATQNPHQFHGTYPLPEGQLDRFMIATSMGYPERRAEHGIVRAQVERRPLEEVEPVVEIREVCEARELVRKVQVHDEVLAYAVALAEATRNHPVVSLGVSPRGSIALIRAAQARAATRGRDFAGPEDVKALAPEALPHRLSVRGGVSGATAEAVIREILDSVPSPA